MTTGHALNAAALAADRRRESLSIVALSAPALVLVAVFLVAPIGWLFWLSLFDPAGNLSAENYVRLVDSRVYFNSFTTTFLVAGIVTALCVVLGYPLAYFLSEMPARLAAILLIAVILPYWTSILVRTYAWLVLLQRQGLVNEILLGLGLIETPLRLTHNFLGTVIGMTHIMLPFLVLPLYASMRSIDRLYMTAAATHGAAPSRAFFNVFVPLSLPGLVAGAFLVFVLCLGFYVTPAILGGGRVIMIAQQIERSIALYNNWGAASALAVVLLVMTLGVLLAAAGLVRLSRSRSR
jgi:putative spermidine/putrescine transport system permease protein/spermidine/putrescine transport system permease protein